MAKHDAFYRAIAERLRAARTEAGLTQIEMAHRLDMTEVGYRNYEQASTRIPVRELVKCAEIFGRPLSYFVGEDRPRESFEELVGDMSPPRRKLFTTIALAILGEGGEGKTDGEELVAVIASRDSSVYSAQNLALAFA